MKRFSPKEVEDLILGYLMEKQEKVKEEEVLKHVRKSFKKLSQPFFRVLMNRLFLLRLIDYEGGVDFFYQRPSERNVFITRRGREMRNFYFDFNHETYYKLLKLAFVRGDNVFVKSPVLYSSNGNYKNDSLSFSLRTIKRMKANTLLFDCSYYEHGKKSFRKAHVLKLLPGGLFYLQYYKLLFFGVPEVFKNEFVKELLVKVEENNG